MKKIGIILIKIYKIFLSPLFPPCCRFYPSCSTYALEAIDRFGLLKGGLLSFWRLLRCHPFSEGGYDPVPPEFTWFRRRIKKKGAF